MNREELKTKISELPLFDKRPIKVKHATTDEFMGCGTKKAICEVDAWEPYAFVGDGYTLIQFKDVFMPILESVDGEVKGNVIHHKGFAALTLFPEDESLKVGDSRFGMIAMNSVDCSSAVVVKFCVRKGDRAISIPQKVSGIKKTHNGKTMNLVKDYMKLVGPVKVLWTNIVTAFPTIGIVNKIEEGVEYSTPVVEFGSVMDDWKLGTRLTKKLHKIHEFAIKNGQHYSLWDLFVDALDSVSTKKYMSDVHKQKKIDMLSESVIFWATTLSI